MIEFAVGRLRLEDHRHHVVQYHPTQIGIGIVPGDGRSELWLDPRILYVLHDQTVELLIEQTADPESAPSPLLDRPVEDGVIMNADGETMQIRGGAFTACRSVTILPDIEAIPRGFLMTPARPAPGKRLNALPGPPEADWPQD
jgi:hypothetical protein